MWVTRGMPTPRRVSYHLGVPVRTIHGHDLEFIGPGDLVLAPYRQDS